MKKEIADQWVQALRSGKYDQGTHSLRVDNKYCCLGVLCDLMPGVRWETYCIFEKKTSYLVERNAASLPGSVKVWSGMETSDGSAPSFSSLLQLNDSLRFSFNQITDHIEKHWEEL